MKNLVFPLVLIIILLGGVFFIFSQKTLKQSVQPTASSDSAQTVSGYTGKVLAGKSAPFLEFNSTDYNKALTEDKIIFLDFYANWCPICRAEESILHTGFNSLTTDQVIGFRVNYNDSDTDSDEKALAKQFNITYQHTKVILKTGKEFSKSLEGWDQQKFNQEINKALE